MNKPKPETRKDRPKFMHTALLVLVLCVKFSPVIAQVSSQDSLLLDSLQNAPLIAGSDTSVIIVDTNEIEEFHPQDMPEDRGFFIFTRNNLANLRITGSIRLNGAYDFQGLQDQDNFQVLDIPVGENINTEPRFFMQANQSRFGLEMERQTAKGSSKLRIEGDFRGSANSFRLRHAYGAYNNFLVGQTWSNFGDVSSIPLTVDFEGPNGSVGERTVQIRFRGKIKNSFSYNFSMESPQVDFGVPDTLATSYQNFPDLTGSFVLNEKWGHVKFAVLYRSIWVSIRDENNNVLQGIGFFIGSKTKINEYNQILLHLCAGRGIARYIGSLTGRGMDVIYNPDTQQFELLSVSGAFLTYNHIWNEKWFLNISIGGTLVRNKYYQPDDTFKQSIYSSVNLFYDYTSHTRFGLEGTYGARINKDNRSGEAARISFIAYFTF